MAEVNVYALDQLGNSYLTMTKEQIINAIEQYITTGQIDDIDKGFISKILELNAQKNLGFWLGTSAEFQALPEKKENVLYLLTDDPTTDDIEKALTDLNDAIKTLNDYVDDEIEKVEKNIDKNAKSIASIKDGSTTVGIANSIKPYSYNFQESSLTNSNPLKITLQKKDLKTGQDLYNYFLLKLYLKLNLSSISSYAQAVTVQCDVPFMVNRDTSDGETIKFCFIGGEETYRMSGVGAFDEFNSNASLGGSAWLTKLIVFAAEITNSIESTDSTITINISLSSDQENLYGKAFNCYESKQYSVGGITISGYTLTKMDATVNY